MDSLNLVPIFFINQFIKNKIVAGYLVGAGTSVNNAETYK